MKTSRKLDDEIVRQLAMAHEDVRTIRIKAPFIGMQGGPHPLFMRVAFHERRAQLLAWMLAATEEQIDSRRSLLEQELGAAIALKGGSMLGLPAEVVEQIAHLELLELGLGLHACQQ